jgi:hypothetical protein
MMVLETLATSAGCQHEETASAMKPEAVDMLDSMGFFDGLGCRDSNPNYLIQSQASYR